jgi:hypothetical protein
MIDLISFRSDNTMIISLNPAISCAKWRTNGNSNPDSAYKKPFFVGKTAD